MTIYILPDKVDAFKKKLNRMISHLEIKPFVTYSEPTQHKITDLHIYNKGWDGRAKNVYFLDLIEVTIDGVCQGDWIMVATVFHQEGITKMINTELFKHKPSQFGSNYYKCDHCGRKESRRNTSHIIFNVKTNEWRQVGSTCVNKMFDNGKYLAEFSVNLFNCIEENFGCCIDNLSGFWGRIPDHYYQQAISVKDMVHCVRDFREAGNTKWKKPEYEGRIKVADGTTTDLNDFYNTWVDNPKIDEKFYGVVSEFVKGLDDESDFNVNIKKAFEAEYIARHEVYIPFFAVKMYLESLNPYDKQVAKAGIKVGEKFAIEGSIKKKHFYEGFYGCGYEITIVDNKTGFEFIKDTSNPDLFEKFTDKEGIIRFSSAIGFIDCRRNHIKLSGRISK